LKNAHLAIMIIMGPAKIARHLALNAMGL